MSAADFQNASGLSVSWVNHAVIQIVGVAALVAVSVVIAMFVHRIGSSEGSQESSMWVVIYILIMTAVIFIFLGFIDNFWI